MNVPEMTSKSGEVSTVSLKVNEEKNILGLHYLKIGDWGHDE